MAQHTPAQLQFAEEILAAAIEDLRPLQRNAAYRRLARNDNLRRDTVQRVADELAAKNMLPEDGAMQFLSPGMLEEIFDIIRQLLPLLIRLFSLFG